MPKKDKLDEILEGYYRWIVDAIDPTIHGTGKAPLLNPTDTKQAIQKDYIEKSRVVEAIGTEENTHWSACNNHGDKSNYECVCGREERNKFRKQLKTQLGLEE